MPAPLPPGIPSSSLVLFLKTTESPAAYNPIANLGDYTGPTQTATIVDVSKHGDSFRRKVKTLVDAGTLAAPCWFDPSVPTLAGNPQALAELAQLSGAVGGVNALQEWLISFIDVATGLMIPVTGPQMSFNAYVSKFSFKEPVAGVYSADFELVIDGKPVYLFPATVMPAGQPFPV